ncbi:hypothetical protein [Candidatus Nanohalovita haloferacivicina]|uniref:hypothetical protein n=1 Tax=Candidatus Nanohalovita haloferacivicina TaxID=2978046 RepID=UPI00325FD746|nr:hypothetical protein HBNXNv_1067 [Candidatus Nanohalobia archaeon BNXNv]
MDMVLELIMAAAVITVTALAVLFVLNGQSTDFISFTDNQSTDARCDLQKTKWEDAYCAGDTGRASTIKTDTASECTDSWPSAPAC